jgi:hypothetical protein
MQNIFKRGSKTSKVLLSPAPNVQFSSNTVTFTEEPQAMEVDSDSLVSRTLARSATMPGQANSYQNSSDYHQIVPYKYNGGSVGYTDLDDDVPMYHRAGESSSQNRAQTPMGGRPGRSATPMQSPAEQPYDRGSRIRPPKRSDTIKNTILFASRFAATVLPNSWGSGAFSIATTIMDAIDVRHSDSFRLYFRLTGFFCHLFIQRARLNEDLTNDLMSRFKAFFYLLNKMKDEAVPAPVLEAFKEWVYFSLFQQLISIFSQEPGGSEDLLRRCSIRDIASRKRR